MAAEYVKILLVGKKAGTEKTSGINSIDVAILIGEGNREWLEAMRAASKRPVKPVWKIDVIIPDPVNYSNCIIDACMAFAPHLFKECPELDNVAKQIGNASRIDFTEEDQIPKSWNKLREQARPIFEKMSIFEAGSISQIHTKYPKWTE